MAVENALSFLRAAGRSLAPTIVIFGPHAFLREYVLSATIRNLAAAGFQQRSFQVGAGEDFSAVLDELRGSDLFAPKLAIACRVLKSRRDRGGEDADDADDSRSSGGADEPALAAMIEEYRGPGHLLLVYDRDSAPAKIRRAAERSGTLVGCLRPFENQVPQYTELFARARGLKLMPAAVDLLISRHAGDLAAIANAIAKAAIGADEGQAVGPDDVDEPSGKRVPGAFEIAETLSRGRPAATLQQIDRALELGRDPVEILAVEIIPLLRRMMVAASLLARRQGTQQIAAAMGFPPTSIMAQRAIEGARQFGFARLRRAWRRAAELDAGFKNGTVKEREQALTALVLELSPPQ